jgi:hypothetical protein
MGVIRNILLVFVSLLLFISFFLSILSITLSSSLTYNNVKTQSVSIIHDVLEQNFNISSLISQNYVLIEYYCKNHSSYTFNADGYTINIPCSVASQGQEAIIEEGVKEIIGQIYYKDYGCTFFACFKQKGIPVFLISKLSHDSFLKFFFLFLAISFVFLTFSFLLVKKKTSLPILAGSVLIIAALPFMKIGNILNFLSDKIYFQFLRIFFLQSRTIAIILLIISGALILLGVILKILGVGISASKLVSKIRKSRNKETK